MSLAWPVGFLFTLAYSRINHEYSSLSIIVIHLIFGAFMRTECFMFFYIKSSIGTKGEVGWL